jgi:hypothetical protein
MNIAEVTCIKRGGVISLLYSHDGGFTRHVVDIFHGEYAVCRINEVESFRRGTHMRMAALHGFDLSDLKSGLLRRM